jgi:hypothetical protein
MTRSSKTTFRRSVFILEIQNLKSKSDYTLDRRQRKSKNSMKQDRGEKMQQDIINTIPEAERLDRREFFVTSILTGAFALAVQPIAAQTKITTDAAGLIAGEVKIPVAGGELSGYRAVALRAAGRRFANAECSGNYQKRCGESA